MGKLAEALLTQAQPIAFFDEAADVFGDDGVDAIRESLSESLEEAHDALPLWHPILGVTLVLSDEPYDKQVHRAVHGTASMELSRIAIKFNRCAEVEAIVENVPDTVVHEITHIAHAHLNPQLRRGQDQLFLYRAVLEGVANHAEFELMGADAPMEGLMWRLAYKHLTDRMMQDAIVDLLENPGTSKEQSAHLPDFLEGGNGYQVSAYTIGQYIVTNMASVKGYDMRQLLEASLAEYREFAETES